MSGSYLNKTIRYLCKMAPLKFCHFLCIQWMADMAVSSLFLSRIHFYGVDLFVSHKMDSGGNKDGFKNSFLNERFISYYLLLFLALRLSQIWQWDLFQNNLIFVCVCVCVSYTTPLVSENTYCFLGYKHICQDYLHLFLDQIQNQ